MSGEEEQLNNPNGKFKFFKTKKFWAIILGVSLAFIIGYYGFYSKNSSKLNEERGAQDTRDNNETSPNGGEGEDNNGNEAEAGSYLDGVKNCGYMNEYFEVNDKIVDKLKENGDFRDYIAEGYKLKEVCGSDDNILLFLDFETGYWENISKDWDELNKLAGKAIIGVSNDKLDFIRFFPMDVEGYFFEGPGGAACSFDKYIDDKVLYFCDKAGDNGSQKGWYAYDTKNNKNIKVKETTTTFPDGKTDKVVFDEDLLELFTRKSSLSECGTEPYVKKYEGKGANDKESVAEYIAPIDCEYNLLFKRQGSGAEYNEWSGVFDVYLENKNDNSSKKIFIHEGILMDIAGGRYWDMMYYGRGLIEASLATRDMGGAAEWIYIIDPRENKLKLGIFTGLKRTVVLSEQDIYELEIDTSFVWCEEKGQKRVTSAISVNGERYPFKEKIIEICPDLDAGFFPPPSFRIKEFDIDGKNIAIDIEGTDKDENLLFNYEQGGFLENDILQNLEDASDEEKEPIRYFLDIPEINLRLGYPANYSIHNYKNINQPNRRGAAAAFYFERENYDFPNLNEIQFFTEDSINDFIEECKGWKEIPCFFGDYPNLERYNGQKEAYKNKQDYENYKLKKIENNYYFVSNHTCQGDICLYKEYTAFEDDIKVDIWIDVEDFSESEKEKKLLSNITFEKIKNENATANNAWNTYTSHDFDFQIDYPAAVSGNEFEVYDFKEIEYGGKHYMMNIEQMFITVFPTETYEFIDVKQSECYNPDDEESCSARHRVSCGSGKCTEIPNINQNVENYDAVLYSQKTDQCYADPSGGTICPEPEYESNILIVKRGKNYYKIKQPIFSPTILIEGEKEAYEAMLKSFRFIE